MTEVWFYQLQGRPLERVLPTLVEKGLARGWRIAVQTVDDLRVKALDDLLWTYAPESFLPHAAAHETGADAQPVVVTRDEGNPNGAQMRLFVEGAELRLEPQADYARVILVFDGANEVELEAARAQWARLKREDAQLSYWRQTEAGQWERQA